MPTPLESPRMKMRQRILREATRQFVERGFDGVSIRDLAEACQVTNAALYYHFPDKEHLFLEILEQGLENFTRILRNAREKYPASTQDCLKEFILGIFTQVPPESRGVMRLATQEMEKLSPGLREKFKEIYAKEFLHPLEEILREGQARGEVRPLPSNLLVWAFLGIFYPFLASESHPNFSANTPEILLSIFWKGIQP